jgi:hypothetical protein
MVQSSPPCRFYGDTAKEYKNVMRTLDQFMSRSNRAFVETFECMHHDFQVYESEYRKCVAALRCILEDMELYRLKSEILDAKTQLLCMRIMVRWFSKVGASAISGSFDKKYGHIFKHARTSSRSERSAPELYINSELAHVIAGTCLIIAIKYQTDAIEIKVLDDRQMEYCLYVSNCVTDRIGVHTALVFYRPRILEIIGLPQTLDDNGGMSMSGTRDVLAHKNFVVDIEKKVLNDLDWKLSEPLEIEFLELYACVVGWTIIGITGNRRNAERICKSIIFVGQCLILLSKIDPDSSTESEEFVPCWIEAMAIVLCILSILISTRHARRKVHSVVKKLCEKRSERNLARRVQFMQENVMHKYRNKIMRFCDRKGAIVIA